MKKFFNILFYFAEKCIIIIGGHVYCQKTDNPYERIRQMVNKVKVVICNKEYILQTEQQPSYVYGLAKMLEKRLNDMCAGNSSVSPYSAAVMVALSTLDDLSKAQQNFDNVRIQAKEYVDEAGKARIERDAAVKEAEALKVQIQQLEDEIKALKA